MNERMNSRQRLAKRLWAQREELRALRDGIVMAHGLCSDSYIQTPQEMRNRARKRLVLAMNKSDWCKQTLGYYPGQIPEN